MLVVGHFFIFFRELNFKVPAKNQVPSDATYVVRVGLSVVVVGIAIIEVQDPCVGSTVLGRRPVVVGDYINSCIKQFSENLAGVGRFSVNQCSK
jgi:hypothetical protein